MRRDIEQGYHVQRGSTPTFDHEAEARKIFNAFKRTNRVGINFRNARPYVIGWYRGTKIYFCSNTAWNKGIEDFAEELRAILAPAGYVNEGLAGHDQYYDLASRVNALIRSEWNPYGNW